jgi:hypothetical protein
MTLIFRIGKDAALLQGQVETHPPPARVPSRMEPETFVPSYFALTPPTVECLAYTRLLPSVATTCGNPRIASTSSMVSFLRVSCSVGGRTPKGRW